MKEAHLQQEEMKRESEREKSHVYQDSLAGAIKNLKGTRDDETDEDVWSEPESEYSPDDWEAEIEEEDEAVLAAFMSKTSGSQKQKTLADIIMEKIKEKESGMGDGVRYVCLNVLCVRANIAALVYGTIIYMLVNAEVAGCDIDALRCLLRVCMFVMLAMMMPCDILCVDLRIRMGLLLHQNLIQKLSRYTEVLVY